MVIVIAASFFAFVGLSGAELLRTGEVRLAGRPEAVDPATRPSVDAAPAIVFATV